MPDEILTSREALEKAFAETSVSEPDTVEAVAETPSDDTPFVETNDRGDEGRERDEFGRFKAKAGEAAGEPLEAAPVAEASAPAPAVEPAPSGFQASAQADWAKTPESVRADVQRRFGELEKGIEKYRAEVEPIRQYSDMARAQGRTLRDVLDQYHGFEQAIGQNPLAGLDQVCRAATGHDLRSIAAHVMGQPAPEPNAQVSQLQQRLDAAERELRGYRADREQTVAQTVQEFAAAHPRFDELTDDIAWLLKTGGARTLEAAYAKADRLNPSPTAAAHTGAAPSAPQPQKPAGPVSIKGAPSSGSNPARATESLSTREAVARAFAAAR